MCARHCQIAGRCSYAAGAGGIVVGVSVGVGWINTYIHTHTTHVPSKNGILHF